MSIQQAAGAIVSLINSKPTSPTLQEIEAILGITPRDAMSPAHAAHYREWRGLIDEHIRKFENADKEGMTKAEIEADETRLAAHLEVMDTLADRIFAAPARTWGDVVLYAQVCFWRHWAGIDPEGSDAQPQLESGPMSDGDRSGLALSKLLEAIFTVAGVGQFGCGHSCSGTR